MKKSFRIYMLLMFCLAVTTSVSSEELKGTIKVTVRGCESNTGLIMVGLYNSEQAFPTVEKHFRGQTANAVGNEIQIVFAALPAGEYAVAAFHDENSNGKLEKDLMGRPQEAYGCSNGAKGIFGPPSFKDAKSILKDNSSLQFIVTLK